MAWIIEVELVEVTEADPPDAWIVSFDVIYPGETWCRSLVRLSPTVSLAQESDLVGQARDALLAVLELQPGPASAEIRVGSEGTEVLRLGTPDLR